MMALLDYVRECVEIDRASSTGLRWRARPPHHFRATKMRTQEMQAHRWNSRHAGTPAGMMAPDGYRKLRICRDGDPVLYTGCHRIVYALHHGAWPAEVIDHIDGNPANNSPENLRDVPHVVNTRNQKTRCTNKSGYPGVSWKPRNRKWVAQIQAAGNKTYLGLHDTPEAAHDAVLAFCAAHPNLGFTTRHLQRGAR